jgi:Mg2+-importing ATPase
MKQPLPVKLSSRKGIKGMEARTPPWQRVNLCGWEHNVVSEVHSIGNTHWQGNRVRKVSERLKLKPDETDFEKGVLRFGYFLMEVTF